MVSLKGGKNDASIRKSVRKAIQTLERRFKLFPLKHGHPSIEHLAYVIAAHGDPEHHAAAAIRDLKATFAGWNEIRVSSVLEIAEVLRNHDVSQPIQKAEQILRSLGRIFSDGQKVKLERLTRDRAEEFRVYMTRKLGLPSHVVADFLFTAFGYNKLPVDENVGRVLQRLGFVTNKLDYPRLEKTLSQGLTNREASHAYRVLDAHAAQTCTERDPACNRCPLFADCPEGQARKAAADAAKHAPPPQPAESRDGKPARGGEAAKPRTSATAASAAGKSAKPGAAAPPKGASVRAGKAPARASAAKPAPQPSARAAQSPARKPARPVARRSAPRPKQKRPQLRKKR